ncbi:hypothetical protein JCM11251_007401 [Rhodosporidiobolus azoricus]
MQPSSPATTSQPRFRPRQSSYLRISPSTVLQMILYLEPAHTEWMNNNVLERMLFALRDRIPLKLQEEGAGKRSGKEKSKVDVFRGADYQMAFFFRRANDKHVVLLKDKDLQYTSRPSQQPPARKPAPAPVPAPSRRRKRARPVVEEEEDGEGDVDLRDAASDEDEPIGKRRPAARAADDDDDDVLVLVKPEPVDDEELPPGSLFRRAEEARDGEVKVEEQEIDEEVKPKLKVTYQGYRIFGRTLVVIVEPYPPLAAADLARPRLLQTEIRQLSASVAPEAYRQSASAMSFRAGTLSATPAPLLRRGRGENALFRRESTVSSVGGRGGTETPVPPGEEDEQMRRLRESTTIFAENEWEGERHEGQGKSAEEDDELPSLDAVLAKERG